MDWTSWCLLTLDVTVHEGQKGTPDSPNFDFADGSDDADTASVATCRHQCHRGH